MVPVCFNKTLIKKELVIPLRFCDILYEFNTLFVIFNCRDFFGISHIAHIAYLVKPNTNFANILKYCASLVEAFVSSSGEIKII